MNLLDDLIRCVHHDRNLAEELDLNQRANGIEKLNTLKDNIIDIKNNFESQNRINF